MRPTGEREPVSARAHKQNQKLIWAVKGDADAFPPDLRRDLAVRADLIVLSHGGAVFP